MGFAYENWSFASEPSNSRRSAFNSIVNPQRPELILNEARIHHNLATDQIKEAAQNILNQPSPFEPNEDSDECDDCEGCEKCEPAD